MNITRITLKKGEEERIVLGHPWIFDNEIASTEGALESGLPVDVFSAKGKYLGRGLVSAQSKIRVRLLTRSKEGFDRGFFKRVVDQALSYRLKLYNPEQDSFRAIYGEADLLPGFICDCFTSTSSQRILVYQSTFAGLEPYISFILEALEKSLSPVAIVERNDLSVREKEGLPLSRKVISGELPNPFIIEENGIKMVLAPLDGQKTGHFLDQQENRKAIMPYCHEAHVLDTFCHTGGFALHAAKGGAKKVTAIDASQEALSSLHRNWELNGMHTELDVLQGNVFDHLKKWEGEPLFDLTILDPPAFTKSRATTENAIRGYKEINYRALTSLRKGGILVTCSCSHYLTPQEFVKLLTDAGKDARRTLKFLETRQQAKDHPVLAGYDESLYLKFHILQAL